MLKIIKNKNVAIKAIKKQRDKVPFQKTIKMKGTKPKIEPLEVKFYPVR